MKFDKLGDETKLLDFSRIQPYVSNIIYICSIFLYYVYIFLETKHIINKFLFEKSIFFVITPRKIYMF